MIPNFDLSKDFNAGVRKQLRKPYKYLRFALSVVLMSYKHSRFPDLFDKNSRDSFHKKSAKKTAVDRVDCSSGPHKIQPRKV